MGNLVADAMRAKYPGVDAAFTNSGGLRADLICAPPSAGEQACEITWGEMFAVLPFGNRTVIETLTGAQLEQAFINGFSPVCNSGDRDRPLPAGLRAEGDLHVQRDDAGGDRDVEDAAGHQRARTPRSGRRDTVRFVTNDFMYAGGDGYTVFTRGRTCCSRATTCLEVAVDYVDANSPVAPVVEGRIVKQ